MEDAAINIYHVLVSTVTLAGGLMGLFWYIRQMNRDRRQDMRLIREEAARNAARWTALESDVNGLKSWRADHESSCSVEHQKICDSVEASAQNLAEHMNRMESESRESRKMIYERMTDVEKLTSEVNGALKIIIPAMQRSLDSSASKGD